MQLLSWDCSNAILEQVENSKKEMIAHGVYGKRQKLSCWQSQGSEAGRGWGFFLSLSLNLFLLVTGICQSLGVPLKQSGFLWATLAIGVAGPLLIMPPECPAMPRQVSLLGSCMERKCPLKKGYGEPRQRAPWQERKDSSQEGLVGERRNGLQSIWDGGRMPKMWFKQSTGCKHWSPKKL